MDGHEEIFKQIADCAINAVAAERVQSLTMAKYDNKSIHYLLVKYYPSYKFNSPDITKALRLYSDREPNNGRPNLFLATPRANTNNIFDNVANEDTIDYRQVLQHFQQNGRVPSLEALRYTPGLSQHYSRTSSAPSSS